MASVYKRKDGRWEGIVQLPRLPNGTKPKPKHVYGMTKADVEIQVTEIKYQVQNNVYVDPGRIALGDHLRNWADVYLKQKAETTEASYRLNIEKHIIPTLGHVKLKDLLPRDIQKYINKKLDEGYTGKTVGKHIVLLNQALNSAIADRLIISNPCAGVKRPAKEKYEPAVFNEQQMATLLEYVKGTYDEVVISLAAFLGLRRGEVFGLRWRDVDEKNKTISICETITRFNKEVTKPPKTLSSRRTIIVPDIVLDILKKYRGTLSVISERVCDKTSPIGYSHRFRNLITIYNRGKKKELTLPASRFHDLRHFNGTMLMKYGVSDTVAAGRLGHSSTQTTKIYQHKLNDMDVAAAGILDKIYKNSVNR